MKRIFCSSLAAVVLTASLLSGCGSAPSSSIASSASSPASSVSSVSSSSSTPASSSEASSISSSISSSSSQPEPEKPAYSKVEVVDCSFDKNTYVTVSTITITVGGYVHSSESKTTHYEIVSKVTLKNTGTLDRTVNESNFAVLWDGSPLEIDELRCNGSSSSYNTTLKAGETATYTLEVPITEEQYNDWASQHIITLTSMFKEADSANDTYTVYQYLTSTGAVSLKK